MAVGWGVKEGRTLTVYGWTFQVQNYCECLPDLLVGNECRTLYL